MECDFKLKLTPKQLQFFVSDWQVNYKNLTFEEYFDLLIKECFDEESRNDVRPVQN